MAANIKNTISMQPNEKFGSWSEGSSFFFLDDILHNNDTHLHFFHVLGGLTKWPNILIVENDKLSQMEQIMGGNKTTNNQPPTLRFKGNSSSKEEPQLKEILAVYSDGDKKNIFVFPANEVKKISLAHPVNRNILHSCQMYDKHDHICFHLKMDETTKFTLHKCVMNHEVYMIRIACLFVANF